MPPIRLTTTDSVTSTAQLETWTFPDFDALCRALTPLECAGKADAPLLIPVAAWHDENRSEANVAQMAGMFCADFDRLTDAESAQVFNAVDGLSCLVYSTHSHLSPSKSGLWCFRVLVELDREYLPEQHAALWHAVNARLGGRLDPAGLSPQLPYYVPSHRPGAVPIFVRIPGAPFVVPTADAAPMPTARPADVVDLARPERPSAVAIAAAVQAWSRYRGTDVAQLERAAVAKGATQILLNKNPEIPIGEGRRHLFMISLAGFLAAAFPRSDPTHLAKLFDTNGWAFFASGDDSDHGIDRFADMIDDFQIKELESRAVDAAQAADDARIAIAAATGGARDTPLTTDELAALEQQHGPSWHKRAVVQFKNGYLFMRPDGSYHERMWSDREMLNAAKDHFAPFGDHVSLTFVKDDQIRNHGYESFMREYGVVAAELWYDMTIERSVFVGGSMAVACAKPRVSPKEHKEIGDWLYAIGGDILVDWAAGCSRLNEMLPVLVLSGPPSAGKTLIAHGCARIWTPGGPNDAEYSHSQYNAGAMLKQPITLHDEKAGAAYKTHGTSLVRQYVTQSSRYVEEKHLPRVEVRGYPRLIFAANDPHILDTSEDTSAEGREAFAERIVHIELDENAAAFGRAYRETIATKWLAEDWLAEHVLWLGKNHTIKHRGDRFLIKAPRTSLHASLAGGHGVGAEVIQWLLNYLDNPGPIDNRGGAKVQIDKKKHALRVTSQVVFDTWGQVFSKQSPPKISDISKAIKSISKRQRQKITANGKTYNAYEIDLDVLRANLDRHHLTVEAFEAALGFL